MLGKLEFSAGGWGKSDPGEVHGLPVLLARADPDGFLGGHRLARAGRSLRLGGVVCTLLPPGFARWDLLEKWGLKGVDTGPLLRSSAPALALAALDRRGIDPRRAAVALAGGRTEGEMTRTALCLCPRVRALVIDAPDGERLAKKLRRELGVPILPRNHPAQLALGFSPGEGARREPSLRLYGRLPELDGLALTAPALGDERDLAVLCALWQRGKLPLSGVKIHTN